MTSLREAVADPDRRVRLEAIRDVLADSVAASDPDKRAPLAKLLVEVLARIDNLPTQEASAVDDLASARAKRRGSPNASADGVKRRAGSGGAGGDRGTGS